MSHQVVVDFEGVSTKIHIQCDMAAHSLCKIDKTIEYIKNNVSLDAVFHVCGGSQFYIHVSMDGDMVCVDDCALSDLPEYEGSEPDELRLEA